MKISDFLRLRITPENKQFDAIRNIRFYDDKEMLLVGKGTTSVQSFCEAFFDYVYRNYSSSRGAEKLVKSNRKKYTKYSSSENMALVQRILNEICNDYAITNYNITCEVDNGSKKTASQAAPVQQKPVAPAPEKAKVAPKPEVVGSNNAKNDGSTVKLKALESELDRLNNVDEKIDEKAVDKIEEPEIDYSILEEPYIHPDLLKADEKKEQEKKQNQVQGQQPKQVNPQAQAQQQGQEKPKPQATAPAQVQPQGQGKAQVQPQTVAQPQGQVQPQPQVQQKAQPQPQGKPQAQVQQQVKPQAQPTQQSQGQVQPQAQVQPQGQVQPQPQAKPQAQVQQQVQPQAQPAPQTQGQPQQQNQGKQNKHDKKHGKKQDFPDARMKPGKGYKPFKPNEHFKEAPKFQAADNSKSNLDIAAIPCIAVIEDNKVPTMEEVPFIGIPEDNSVPNMSDVPFVGIEDSEASKPIPDVPYIGEEDGEAGKPIPDVPYLGAEDGEKGKPIPNVPYLGTGDYMDSSLVEPSNVKPIEVDIYDDVLLVPQNIENGPEFENAKIESVDDGGAENNAEAPEFDEVVPTISETDEENLIEQEAQIVIQTIAQNNNQPIVQPDIQPEVQSEVQTINQPIIEPSVVLRGAHTEPRKGNSDVSVKAAKKASKTIIQKDIKQLVASSIRKYSQLVFIGPSGTGKTYQVRKFARKNTKGYDGYKFVQFHPSFEYSDFIEGLRPVNIINTTNATNVRIDGVFKAFCRKIVEDNLEHAISGFSSMYSEKKQKVIQDLFEKIRDKKEALEEGTEYRDFDRDSAEYIFEHGVREYYFIIDEFNRADAARVFGDVMFALDEDYRGIENRFDTRLGNLKTYRIIQADDLGKANYSTSHIGFAEQMKFDCFERGFFIPRNLHIIGTMNELGGTVEDVDFSLKQKFKWISINPSEIMTSSLNEMLKDKDIFWLNQFANNLNLVNKLISDGFSEEYCLGPAFFRKLDESPESIDEVFEMDVEPVLKEYLKGKPQDITEMFISECRKALKLGI